MNAISANDTGLPRASMAPATEASLPYAEVPLAALHKPWLEAVAALDAYENESDVPELGARLTAIEDEIFARRPETVEDYACKILVAEFFINTEGFDIGDNLMAEARELVGGAPDAGKAPNLALDGVNLPDGVRERLARFAEWTGTTPPDCVLDEDRAFTTDFLIYCNENGLSLDWVWAGDERGLVMRAHNAAREGRV